MDAKEAQRYIGFVNDELNGVMLYHALAANEKNPKLAEVYRRMATVEQHHADEWLRRLHAEGVQVSPFKPAFRTHLLSWMAKRLGVNFVLPSVTAMESNGANAYARVPNAGQMSADEQSHGRMLGQITQTLRGGIEGGALAQIEGRHRGTGNALRAAVLGANDGLVSTLSLVMGVAGAGLSSHSILITGLAGLLAGAISMALGEWLSVQSSRELYTKQIAIEKAEIEASPDEEIAELSLIYEIARAGSEQGSPVGHRSHGEQGYCARYPRARRTGREPRRTGWVRLGSSSDLIPALRSGRIIARLTLHFLWGDDGCDRERRICDGWAICYRCSDLALHRPDGVVLWDAYGGVWALRRDCYLHDWTSAGCERGRVK